MNTSSHKADDQGFRETEGMSNFGVLEAKVEAFAEWKSEIKEDLRDLNKNVKDLGAAITKMSEPKWLQWAAGAGLLLSCGAGLYHFSIDPIAIQLGRTASKELVDEKNSEYAREILRLQDEYRFLDSSKMARTDMSDMRADINSKIAELTSKITEFNRLKK